MPQALSPSTSNYSILKAHVLMRAAGAVEYFELGNVPELTYTPSVEKLAHYSSMAGVKAQDDETTVQVGAEVTLTLDEITTKNLAKALHGSTAALAQTAAPAHVETIADVVVGASYDLGYLNITSIASVVDETSPTPVAYVLDTDYSIDMASGMIRVIKKPAGAGDDMIVTFAAPAIDTDDGLDVIAIMKNLDAEFALMCVGTNTKGNKYKLELPRVVLQPSGGIGFISDEFAQIQLTGKVLADATSSTYPYGKITPISGFATA